MAPLSRRRCAPALLGLIAALALLPLLASGAATATATPAASVRAVWIPVNEFTSSAAAASYMQSLAAGGVTRVYVDVWNNGKVYFYSPTMLQLIGNDGVGQDQLAMAVQAARDARLEIYAWFEYGLMACYGTSPDTNPFSRKANELGWISGSADGYLWMRPDHAGVVAFLGSLLTDSLASYAIDGVQLDDHFAWPASLTGANAAAMTSCAEAVRGAVRAKYDAPLSLSPYPLSGSLSKYNVDWKHWSDLGLFTEYVPQLYTTSSASFRTQLDASLSAAPPSRLIAGVRCDGSGAPTAHSELSAMIAYAMQRGVGSSVWYSKCVRVTYPSAFPAIWT